MSKEGGSDCCPTHSQGEKSSEKSAGIKALAAPSTSSQSMSCCALESLTAEKSRDVRGKNVSAVAIAPSRINFISSGVPHAQIPIRSARLPDRAGTYLLNCVFLI
jgi:hypothetical protein